MKWFLGAFLFVVALILALVLYKKLTVEYELPDTMAENTENSAEGEDEVKYEAPDFMVYDKDGNSVKLSDFVGSPVVLNFWASWCGPCKAEMPTFDAMVKEYPDVVFMMVNITDGSRETLDKAKDFIESSGYTFPVYFDTELSAAYSYGTSSIPVTYFIDAEGYLKASFTGTIPESVLIQGIGMITE